MPVPEGCQRTLAIKVPCSSTQQRVKNCSDRALTCHPLITSQVFYPLGPIALNDFEGYCLKSAYSVWIGVVQCLTVRKIQRFISN